MEISVQHRKLLIGVVYNANGARANRNGNGLSVVFNDLLYKYQDIIIMGDFYVDMLAGYNNMFNFKDLLATHGLWLTTDFPAHFTRLSWISR